MEEVESNEIFRQNVNNLISCRREIFYGWYTILISNDLSFVISKMEQQTATFYLRFVLPNILFININLLRWNDVPRVYVENFL